jgi:hypothetical protein
MCPVLEAPHLGRKPKHGLYKTENNQYVPQLTEEHISLYSSVNRGIYEHVSEEGGTYSSVTCNQGIYNTIFVDYT